MVTTAKRRNFITAIAAVIVLGHWLVAPVAVADQRVVTIGFGGPITGLNAANGVSMLNGARMAVADLNNAGLSFKGDKLTFALLEQDDRSNPLIAELAARYFVSRKVIGVVGIYNSNVAISSSSIYQHAGIAHFATVGSQKYTQQGHDTAFRLASYYEQRANVLASFAVHELHKTQVSIVHADSQFGIGYKDKFAAALVREGGRVVSVESVSATSFDFSHILSNLKTAQPEAVFFAGLGDQTPMFAKGMHHAGIDCPLIAAAVIVEPTFLVNAGEGAEMTVAIAPGLHQEMSKRFLNFERNYRQKYSAYPGPFSASVYDQVQVLAAAFMQADSDDPHEITKALHGINFKGLTGNISFDTRGELRELAFSMYQVQHGSWVLLKQYHFGAPQ